MTTIHPMTNILRHSHRFKVFLFVLSILLFNGFAFGQTTVSYYYDHTLVDDDDRSFVWPYSSTPGSPGVNYIGLRLYQGFGSVNFNDPFTSNYFYDVGEPGVQTTVDTVYFLITHEKNSIQPNVLHVRIVDETILGLPGQNVLWEQYDTVYSSLSPNGNWVDNDTLQAGSIYVHAVVPGLTLPMGVRGIVEFHYIDPSGIDTLGIIGSSRGGLGGNFSQSFQATFPSSLVRYLPNITSIVENSSVGYGTPTGTSGWFEAQNWNIFPKITQVYNQPPPSPNVPICTKSLGSSFNPYSVYNYSGRPILDYHPQLNTLTFTHRSLQAGGNWLMMDISKDGGTTWQNNLGPIYASGNYNPRYPLGLIYNPPANTTPDSAYLSFSAGGLFNGNWTGIISGATKIGNPTAPVSLDESYASLGRSGLISSFHADSDNNGNIWVIDATMSDSSDYSDTLVVRKGVFNPTLKRHVYTETFIPFPVIRHNGIPIFSNLGLNIAFSGDGLTGYIVASACADLSFSPDSSTYWTVWKTSDGGNTWSTNPFKISADINQFLGSTGDKFRETAFLSGSDAVVDANNKLHFISSSCLSVPGNPNAAYQSGLILSVIFDGVGSTVLSPLSNPDSFFGIFDPNTNFTEGSRAQIAMNPAGTHIYYCWLETDHAYYGVTDNIYPDLFSRKYSLSTGSWENVVKLNGNYEGEMNFACVAKYTGTCGSNDKIFAVVPDPIFSDAQSPQYRFMDFCCYTPPVAAFTSNVTNIQVGQSVNFNDLSTNNPSSRQWSFPGGNPSSSNSASPWGIVYNNVGCYPVSLTVSNPQGTDSVTQICYINVSIPSGPPVITPGGTQSICQGDSITLTSSPASSYLWSTGETTQSIVVSSTGIYQVSTTDSSGIQTSAPVIVTVVNVPYPQFSVINNNLNTPPYLAQFNNLTPGFSAYQFEWDFGDGNQQNSNAATVSHIYGAVGVYSVTLTITDTATGCSLTNFAPGNPLQTVTCSQPGAAPVAAFIANNLVIQSGQSVDFTDLTANNPNSWQWTFTGGIPSSSTLQNPSGISYSSPGCYEVSLVASNAFGSDTQTSTCYINVVAPGTPVISASGPLSFCQGSSVTLSSSYQNGNLWSTGDTTQSIVVTQSGSYSVSITDSSGVLSSAPIVVTVSPLVFPNLDIIGNFQNLCSGTPAQFNLTNVSGQGSNPTFNWYLNGNLAQQGFQSFSIPNPSNNDVLFCIMTSSELCATPSLLSSDTLVLSVISPPLPQYSIQNNNLSSSPLTAQFTNLTPNSGPYDFIWSFGDGTVTQNNSTAVSYTYINNGVFHTGLTAQHQIYGCTITNYNPGDPSKTVTCNAPGAPSCNFTVSTQPAGLFNGCIGGVVNINAANYPIGSSLQWYKNGLLLGGEVFPTLSVTTPGYYTLAATDPSGCSVNSAPVQVNFLQNPVNPPTISVVNNTGACGVVNATLTASGAFASFEWSNGSNSTSITVTSPGIYYVTGLGSASCDAQSLPVNISSSAVLTPEICLVTVEPSSQHHLISWEKPVTNSIDSFFVYKEVPYSSGNYQKIAAVDYSDLSEFEDLNSNAGLGPDRYRISVLDDCGGESAPSAPVRSIHLQVSPGVGVARVLSWTPYSGIQQNISKYLIFSGSSASNMSLIDSVAAQVGFYVDNAPVSGPSTNYRIEARLSSLCESTRALRTTTISNVDINDITPAGLIYSSLPQANLLIIPNPNSGNFEVSVQGIKNSQFTWSLKDMLGRLVTQPKVSSKNRWSVELPLSPGVYFMHIQDGQDQYVQKVIIR